MSLIETRKLRKTFHVPVAKSGRWSAIRTLFSRETRQVEAVKEITLGIEQGDFVGYIGPNGAGKSTTIKMLCGILHPSAGEVAIGGLSPQRERIRVVRRLGVVFGQRTQLWWDLPVKDSFDILAAMYRVDAADYSKRLAALSDVLELGELLATPVRKLSLGQRMRADLAASLLHDPDILFLDEPTVGLDVTAKKQIRAYLNMLNRDLGKTILLTTHDMDDIEQLCSRVMVINHGLLIYDGTIGELRRRIGLPSLLTITFEGSYSVPDDGAEGRRFQIIGNGVGFVKIQCNRQDISAVGVLRQVEGWGTISDVHMEEPDFEEVVHRIY